MTGEIVVSASALELLTAAGVPPRALIERHVSGDFGEVEAQAARENLQAATTGVRVLSRYAVGGEGGVGRRRNYSAGVKHPDRP